MSDNYFLIASLTDENAASIDYRSATGSTPYPRTAIAAGEEYVFLGGPTLGRFDTGLDSGERIDSSVWDGIFADPVTGDLYTLLGRQRGPVAFDMTRDPRDDFTLLTGVARVDPESLALSDHSYLDFSLSLEWASAVFVGPGRLVVYRNLWDDHISASGGVEYASRFNAGELWEIDLEDGSQEVLGTVVRPQMAMSKSGAPAYGVAEYFEGSLHLVYRNIAEGTIERLNVSTGNTEVLARFDGLSDSTSFAVSEPLGRWFTHSFYPTQFGDGLAAADVRLGSGLSEGAGDGDDTLSGTPGSDLLLAGPGADDLSGLGGDDTVFGDTGDDRLAGGQGDDELRGGPGNDRIEGGEGEDTAVFSGFFLDYAIEEEPGGAITVTDMRAGAPDGSDTLVGVEHLGFSADRYAVDDLPGLARHGEPFRVNEAVSLDQSDAAVAALSEGRFVATWSTGDRGPSTLSNPFVGDYENASIRGRILTVEDDGTVTARRAFAVNASQDAGVEEAPAVAALSESRFVVAWRSGHDTVELRVLDEIEEPDGAGGPDFGVVHGGPDVGLPGRLGDVSVVPLSDDRFVVAHLYGVDVLDVHETGAVAVVSSFTSADPIDDVAKLSERQIAVVSNNDNGGWLLDVSADGTLTQGPAFDVGRVGANYQVAGLSEGRFVAAWASYVDDDATPGGVGGNIRARIYEVDESGAVTADDAFVVNGFQAGRQGLPTVQGLPDGGFLVAWLDGHQDEVRARWFDREGEPVGRDVVLDRGFVTSKEIVYDSGDPESLALFGPREEHAPAVAVDPTGTLLAMWDSDRLDPSLQDDAGADVRARAVRVEDLPPPLAAANDTATTDEDTAVTIDVLANDAGADPLTVLDARLLSGDGGVSVVGGGGAVSFDPGGDYDSLPEGDSATVVIAYDVSDGRGDTATGTAEVTVEGVNDAPTGAVTIAGTPTQGETLTAANTLSDADGLGAIAYQWQRDGSDIAGATAATYTLTQADVGAEITVVASYTDGGGAEERVASAATDPVANVNDAPVLVSSEPTLADAVWSEAGQSVASILAASVTDDDPGAVEGVAVAAVTGRGTWQYSLDDGASWTTFPPVRLNASLLLEATDRVRYVPDATGGETPTLAYFAWDRTSGTAGDTADASTRGGATAFSDAGDAASLVVPAFGDPPTLELTPIALDVGDEPDSARRIPVAEIAVVDDGIGNNALALSGADAGLFEIDETSLFLRAGVDPSAAFGDDEILEVIVEVDDPLVGASPDDTARLVILEAGAETAAAIGGDTDDILQGTSGGGLFRPGLGEDRMILRGDGNTIVGTPADLHRDVVEGFGVDDVISVVGTLFGRDAVTVTAGSASLSIDTDGDGTHDTTITLEGDFDHGDFMAVTSDGNTEISFETFLPALAESQPVDPALVNGILNRGFLNGDNASAFAIELLDLGHAGYDNVLGAYEIAPDGSIVDARLLSANANADKGRTVTIEGVDPGHTLGFFLVQDAAEALARLGDVDSLVFVDDEGTPGAIEDGTDLSLLVNGAALDAPVWHSFSPALNSDGLQHALSGVDEGGEAIVVGFEDLTGGGDRDYEDVAFRVSLVDPAELL